MAHLILKCSWGGKRIEKEKKDVRIVIKMWK